MRQEIPFEGATALRDTLVSLPAMLKLRSLYLSALTDVAGLELLERLLVFVLF